MKLIISSFLLILSLGLHAKGYNLSTLKHDKNKYIFKVTKELQHRMEAVVPKTHFILFVEAELKIIYNQANDQLNPTVLIDKLGVGMPLGQKIIKKRRIYRETLFDNIRSLKVVVNVDETVSDSKITDIKQIVYSMVRDLPKNRIYFESNRIVLVGNNSDIILQRKIDSVKNFIDQNKTLFNILFVALSSIAIIFFFFKLLNLWTQKLGVVGDRFLSFLENSFKYNNLGHIKDVGNKESSWSISEKEHNKNEEDPIEKIKSQLGFFIKNTKKRPTKLSILINSWVYDKPEGHQDGLALIPFVLDHKTFGEVMLCLSDDTKKNLGLYFGKQFSMIDIEVAINFIQSQLPLISFKEEDIDLDEIILGMTNDEYVEVIKKEIRLAPIILQKITYEQSKYVMKRFPNFIMEELIDQSLVNDISLIEAKGKIKEIVSIVREEKALDIPPTFMAHIVGQLKTVSRNREKNILKMFLDNKRTEVLFHITKEVFPSELILRLPSSIIKVVLSSFSLEFKVKLLMSVPEDDRVILMEYISSSGIKEQKFIELEMKRINESAELLSKMCSNSDDTWRDFAHAVRRVLRTDKQAEKHAQFLLENWIYTSLSKSQKETKLKKVA